MPKVKGLGSTQSSLPGSPELPGLTAVIWVSRLLNICLSIQNGNFLNIEFLRLDYRFQLLGEMRTTKVVARAFQQALRLAYWSPSTIVPHDSTTAVRVRFGR